LPIQRLALCKKRSEVKWQQVKCNQFISNFREGMVNHEHWMRHCLELAEKAYQQGEVPVAAVLVKNDRLVAEAFNQPIGLADPSAHAEILVLRKAAQSLGNYRLPGCTLYVTLEPCTMCAGALVHARIDHLVYGAQETRAGAVVSRQHLLDQDWLNHRVTYEGGVLQEQCAELMQKFFRERRQPES
jgi:tRNA(adenine34) deaminase